VFDETDRDELRPRRRGEAAYSYVNRSARPEMARVRGVIGPCYAEFPTFHHKQWLTNDSVSLASLPAALMSTASALSPAWSAGVSGRLYHGSTAGGIEELEPRRRFTPGVLGTAAPPAVYATDDPAYAAAQAFPWSSAEGFDLHYADGAAVLTVPAEHAPRLEQPIYVYEVPAASFELLPDVAPRGRNYRSLRAVRPLSVQTFPTVRAGIERLGGRVCLATTAIAEAD
jgi:hypothetical protein